MEGSLKVPTGCGQVSIAKVGLISHIENRKTPCIITNVQLCETNLVVILRFMSLVLKQKMTDFLHPSRMCCRI